MSNCTIQGPGFLMFFKVGSCTPHSEPKGLHGGGGAMQLPWNGGNWYPRKTKKPVIDPSEQARIKRIMREDREILDFIITFVTKGP